MRSLLLDDLAKNLGVYISELHDRDVWPRTMAALQELPAGRYLPDQWNYCLGYLLPEHKNSFCFATDDEVAAFLHSINKPAV